MHPQLICPHICSINQTSSTGSWGYRRRTLKQTVAYEFLRTTLSCLLSIYLSECQSVRWELKEPPAAAQPRSANRDENMLIPQWRLLASVSEGGAGPLPILWPRKVFVSLNKY